MREVAALTGAWYRQRAGAYGDQETRELHWDVLMELCQTSPDDPVGYDFAPDALPIAERLLERNGYARTPETVARLAAALVRAEGSFRELVTRRIAGDWSPDSTLATFPELRSSEAAVLSGLTFDELLRGWALDRGLPIAKPIPRALYDRKRTLERLAVFLGHRDAERVRKADVVRWKEDALRRGRTVATVRNDISEMSALWTWAMRNDKLADADNPFQGTLPPKARRKSREPRPFTDAEAARILRAAREQRGFMRWLPWVLCLTGARLNEICQADKADVVMRDGVPIIRIHDDGEGRTLKNADSRRTVPLHPALVSEGFLEYVASLPDGVPLWPDVRPDAVFGLRSVTAGRKVGRWLRSELAMNDPLISPNHSWRHWFIGACRGVVMPLEVRSAITGHSAKMDESASYGDGMGTLVQVVARYMAMVPCPVPDH